MLYLQKYGHVESALKGKKTAMPASRGKDQEYGQKELLQRDRLKMPSGSQEIVVVSLSPYLQNSLQLFKKPHRPSLLAFPSLWNPRRHPFR
jgi:hypothetical protein